MLYYNHYSFYKVQDEHIKLKCDLLCICICFQFLRVCFCQELAKLDGWDMTKLSQIYTEWRFFWYTVYIMCSLYRISGSVFVKWCVYGITVGKIRLLKQCSMVLAVMQRILNDVVCVTLLICSNHAEYLVTWKTRFCRVFQRIQHQICIQTLWMHWVHWCLHRLRTALSAKLWVVCSLCVCMMSVKPCPHCRRKVRL